MQDIVGSRRSNSRESMAELEGTCARFCAERMTGGERRTLEIEHQASARLVRLGAGAARDHVSIVSEASAVFVVGDQPRAGPQHP